ncbi:MAG: HIT family protein [Anaerolineales bacterium]|jgi:histidine triad (HIT) family protein
MEDCPFCRMIKGDLAATFVYQNSLCSALMIMQPVNPGHVLLIPNEHIGSLEDLPLETAHHLIRVSQHLASAIRGSGFECDGINLYLADGRAAGQNIPHLQLHIIPRAENDGFELNLSARSAELPTKEELEKNAHHLRQALKDLTIED